MKTAEEEGAAEQDCCDDCGMCYDVDKSLIKVIKGKRLCPKCAKEE